MTNISMDVSAKIYVMEKSIRYEMRHLVLITQLPLEFWKS